MGATGRRRDGLLGAVRDDLRGHDAFLYAAGATFYFAIAIVPLLLLAIRLSTLLAGVGAVRAWGDAVAGLLPQGLHARSGVHHLVQAGSSLAWPRAVASLLPASLYGEGLRRALDRLSPRDEGAARPAWVGRALMLASLAAAPLLSLGALLGLVAAGGLLAHGGALAALGGVAVFLGAWVLGTALVVWIFRGVAPDRPAASALLRGAATTAAAEEIVLVGLWLFLHLPLKAGTAYGGFFSVGGAAVLGGWVLAAHVVLLVGYVLTLRLAARAAGRRSATGPPGRRRPRPLGRPSSIGAGLPTGAARRVATGSPPVRPR